MCRSGSPRDRKRRLLDTPSECSPYSSHHVTRGSISRGHNRQCPIRLEDELPNLFLLGWVHVDCAVLTPDNRGPKHRVFPVIDNGRRWLERDFVDEHPIGQQPDTSPDEVFKVRRHLPRCPPEQRPGGQVASHQLRSSFCVGHAPPSFGDEIGRAWLSRSLQRQRSRHLRCGIFGSGAAFKLALTVSAVIRLRFPPNEPVIGGRYVRDFTSTSEE